MKMLQGARKSLVTCNNGTPIYKHGAESFELCLLCFGSQVFLSYSCSRGEMC